MYRGLRRLLLAAALLALGTATRAEAGNLIAIPSFDSLFQFLGEWFVDVGTWADLDFEDNPLSGSVIVTTTLPGAGASVALVSPCIAVTPGETYEFSAWQYQPSPRPINGYAQLVLEWLDLCPLGAILGGSGVNSYEFGAWTLVSGFPTVAPVGVHGAQLALKAIRTPSTGTFSVTFDEVFVPEPDESASVLAAAASLAALCRRRGPARRDGSRQNRTAAC